MSLGDYHMLSLSYVYLVQRVQALEERVAKFTKLLPKEKGPESSDPEPIPVATLLRL